MLDPNSHKNIERAVQRFAAECGRLNHEFCGGTADCEKLEKRFVSTDMSPEGIGHDWIKRREPPSYLWTTSELMRCVKDLLLAHPEEDPHRRATFLTIALARLAERGLSPDAILRTGFGQVLLDKILEYAIPIHRGVVNGEIGDGEIPRLGWIRALQEDEDISGVDPADTPRIKILAQNGKFNEIGSQWLRQASVAHLIDWRIDDFLSSPASEDELVLHLGADATIWVCERFTQTYMDEWRIESLKWEIAFIFSPETVSTEMSIPLEVLEERTLNLEQLGQILVNRLCHPANHWESGAVALLEGRYRDVLNALEGGEIEKAVAVARRGLQKSPREPRLRNALAFCLIPTKPAEALSLINSSPSVDGYEKLIHDINSLCARMSQRETIAVSELRSIVSRAEKSLEMGKAWLWISETLPQDPKFAYQTPLKWARDGLLIYE